MKRFPSVLAFVIALFSADMVLACCVTSGQIVARDSERQLVQLADGTIYHVPNRVWLSKLRPRSWATLWYRERDGARVVWNQEVRSRFRRFF